MKPVKRGFKVWVRADAVTGYFSAFDVYIGRPSDGSTTEVGLGERVVLELSEDLRGGHYKLYFDNYFTTCRLLDTLLSQQLYACGTTRAYRRDFPESLKQLSLKQGEHQFCQRGSLVASVWMDKKLVSTLSTLAQPNTAHTVQRRQKDGSRIPVRCTEALVLYNQYMSGVDKGDQLRQYYRVRTKSRKNYKYIFWFLFDVAITNSYILSLFSPTCMPISHQRLKVFRLQLAEQLVGMYNTRKHPGRPRSAMTHPPPALPPPDENGQLPPQASRTALHLPSKLQKKRRCVYCLYHRDPPQRHDVLWYCRECPQQPCLCLTGKEDGSDCFRLWHQKLL